MDLERASVSQSQSITIKSEPPEIEFGYDLSDFVVLPGSEDETSTNYTLDGRFINHQQSVTLVVHNGQSLPILCWVLLIALLLSVVISIVVICCFCIRQARISRTKQNHQLPTHINGFAPVEMIPKYISPAQSYSTQKLYQWCQQRELQNQQYKSLWAVNPTSTASTSTTAAPASPYQNGYTESTNAYKTRSLPSKNKQRPVSSIDDLDELYSQVNFSKKLRNRMTNDEAAIIAFCRSKSQNLSQFNGPKNDATIIYDERTAL